MNFLLLGGNIGRPPPGPCPVRGHSNVQGDRTMGDLGTDERFVSGISWAANFNSTRHAIPAPIRLETIKGMHDGRIQFFLGMGGNFLSATPDTEYTAKALQKCRVTAHVPPN